MKTALFILSMAALTCYGQTADCDCSPALNEALKTRISSTEYRDFKNWLYDYFRSDETTRIAKKQQSGSSWSAGIKAVIEAIPVSGNAGGQSSSSSDNQRYYHMEKIYEHQNYLTDEQFNEFISEKFDVNQLEAYKACLELCGHLKKSPQGISYVIGGDVATELFIQVTFNAQAGGGRVTFAGNATYTNLEPIGELLFKDGLVITDRQTKTQYFRRLDPSKPASFTFNPVESIAVGSIELPASSTGKPEAMPIGTIVSSVLPYGAFLEANRLPESGDMAKVAWVPCDGRNVAASKYGKFAGVVPDLRGVFLRGINEYAVPYPGVSPVSAERKNPDNTTAGQFQADELKTHKHKIFAKSGSNGNEENLPPKGGEIGVSGDNRGTPEYADRNIIAETGGTETRPKNVTVYYYIRIN